MSITSFNRSNNTLPLVVAILFFSIDLSTYLSSYLPVSMLKSSFILVALVLMTIYKAPLNTKKQRIWVWDAIFVYMCLLFLRLSFDFFIPQKGFFIYQSPFTIFFFFIATMLIPFVFFKKKKIEIDNNKWGIIMGIILTICMAVSFKQNILLGQAEAINGQFSGEGTVDIISYGHYGCSLVIIGVFLLFNKPKLITICCCVFCIAFGLVSMTLSGARSSFIALFLCLILLLLGKVKKRKIIFVLALSLIVLAPLFLHILELVNSNLEENGIYSFSRVFAFLSSSDNVTSSGRDVLFAHGWKLFLSNPVFGYSYLLPDDSYVHNIFIEQFMALGLLGGLLFFVINIKAVSICWHIVKTDFSMILFPVLFIQYLVFGCFSRTIIALIPYWLFLFLSINSYDRIRKGISSHSDL